MTRHVDTATSEIFKDGQRVVPYAAARIANRVVRNMGTMGGSISFADPAADYLAALTAADAVDRYASPRGKPTLPVCGFRDGLVHDGACVGRDCDIDFVPAMPAGSIGTLRETGARFWLISQSCQLRSWRKFEERFCSVSARRGRRVRPSAVAASGSRSCAGGIALERLADRQKPAVCWLQSAIPVDDVRASGEYRRKVLPRLLVKALITDTTNATCRGRMSRPQPCRALCQRNAAGSSRQFGADAA